MKLQYPDKDALGRALYILGKEHTIDVAKYIRKGGWQTASKVARDLNMHIATAVKYLSELHELGIAERRVTKGGRGDVFEYRVRYSKIEIGFDVSKLSRDM